MTSKKPAPQGADDLLAELDSLSTQAASRPTKTTPSTASTTSSSRHHQSRQQPNVSSQSEQDLLDELGNLASQRPNPTSRPGTPSLKPNPSAGGTRSPKRSSTATPPPPPPSIPPGRMSDEKSTGTGARGSGDSQRSSSQNNPTFTPATGTTTEEEEESPEPTPQPARGSGSGGGGGWWGGLLSTATAAVTQAQAAVKEIQKNEEAQRWADQVRGNLGGLKGLGGDLKSMALPTFQNLLQTIAPPISSHERLQLHITHDLSGYPSLDPLIYQVFSRVMSQVEGGDLIVVQRGQESSPKRDSTNSSRPSRELGGWNDGPWWRSSDYRTLNAVQGVTEGTKLARANAEGHATEFFSGRGGVEEAAKKATETLSETNPTRNSDIFLAVQAMQRPVEKGLFSVTEAETEDASESEEVLFAIYIHDPIHGIAYSAISQAVPSQWVNWIQAASTGVEGTLPESIEEIIENGGVDPREWVSEWIEESLSLVVGVVAQRYVAKRMGVGEGGIGKGKMRADRHASETVEGGGGEAARALGGL